MTAPPNIALPTACAFIVLFNAAPAWACGGACATGRAGWAMPGFALIVLTGLVVYVLSHSDQDDTIRELDTSAES